MAIHLYGHNLEITPELRTHVEREIDSLVKFMDQALWEKVKVELGMTSKGQKQGSIFRAEINLPVPGKLLRAEATAENLHTAINEAKELMERHLRRYQGRQKPRR